MPRPPRPQVAGGVYHIGIRGVRRQRIFTNDSDCEMFSRFFGSVVERSRWQCHAYCLMPNHYHLLIETAEPNLSVGMQRLNSRYAQWFNDEHGLSGHVFDRRFYSRLVESTVDLIELARYLLLNPVRAGVCKDAGAWRWSSYRALVGQEQGAAFLTIEPLLEYFGRDRSRARERFREFILDAPARARPP
jgi:REP-associated tyrosine transposase